ncbi:hypothetical protein BDC45DRAFT_122840 [Circinella umbellata]|nr:hypothetical protein BDC45DRAFT_122840 [Circinella umbellata]
MRLIELSCLYFGCFFFLVSYNDEQVSLFLSFFVFCQCCHLVLLVLLPFQVLSSCHHRVNFFILSGHWPNTISVLLSDASITSWRACISFIYACHRLNNKVKSWKLHRMLCSCVF